MKKFLQKRLNNEKGLTLVELLAVIVILGIIAAIAVPSIGNIIQNTREKAVVADAQNVFAAANIYFTDKGSANGDTVSLTTSSKVANEGLVPSFLSDAGKLDTAIVTKLATGNTISFSGEAGTKVVAGTSLTKDQLNDFNFTTGVTDKN